jgi:hypothetical protein
MSNRLIAVFLAGLGCLIVSRSLFAHHGNAAFDETKYLTITGTVTEWFWANPHCWLKFDVKDDKDNLVHWVAETSNPPDMINRGWTKQMFKAGDKVTVTVLAVKNGRPLGRIRQVVLPAGQTLTNEGGLNPNIPNIILKP